MQTHQESASIWEAKLISGLTIGGSTSLVPQFNALRVALPGGIDHEQDTVSRGRAAQGEVGFLAGSIRRRLHLCR